MPGDFDLHALQAAIDAQRTAGGLTWAAVGKELGVSAGTLRGLGTQPTAEGDGVLRALAWLGRSAESFMAGRAGAAAEAWIPPGPARTLRFDARALYAALEAERVRRKQTWSDVAVSSGLGSAAGFARMRDGGRVMFPAVMHVLAWLGLPAARFVRIETPQAAT